MELTIQQKIEAAEFVVGYNAVVDAIANNAWQMETKFDMSNFNRYCKDDKGRWGIEFKSHLSTAFHPFTTEQLEQIFPEE